MENERAIYEGSQALRIDIENAQFVKNTQGSDADTLKIKVILIRQQMMIADKADIPDLERIILCLETAIKIQKIIEARPISAQPRALN
jgi:hypothetical protein